MDNKPAAQNIQDTFLNTIRKDRIPVCIYLIGGVKLIGKIRSFDKYSVLLEINSLGATDFQERHRERRRFSFSAAYWTSHACGSRC